MAKKFKAEVLDAVVDGKRKGESVELDEKSAKHLERIGYVRVTGEVKAKAAPKKKSAPKAKPNTKDK
jgi:hypothetical protein